MAASFGQGRPSWAYGVNNREGRPVAPAGQANGRVFCRPHSRANMTESQK